MEALFFTNSLITFNSMLVKINGSILAKCTNSDLINGRI